MNILLITLGSRGDINPFISLGIALKVRGHQVTVISSEIYEKLVTGEGMGFISCSAANNYHATADNPDFYSSRKHFPILCDYMMLRPMRPLYEIISRFDPKNTILVATFFSVAPRIASEKLGFPLTSVCLQPLSIYSLAQPAKAPGVPELFQKFPFFLKKCLGNFFDKWVMDKVLAPEVNKFRLELGLGTVNKIFSQWMYSPQRVMGLFPDWFAQPAYDWPQNTVLPGFVKYDENVAQDLSPELLSFIKSEEPPVVLTYGTSGTQGEKFFRVSLEALRIIDRKAIILTSYSKQLPELRSDREMLLTYVPFTKLLPHVVAIVHHGGIGTIAQALKAKVPQLIVPLMGDQPDNACRVQKLGSGLMLSPQHYTVRKAVESLNYLCKSDAVKAACERNAKKINFQQALEESCSLIESLGRH